MYSIPSFIIKYTGKLKYLKVRLEKMMMMLHDSDCRSVNATPTSKSQLHTQRDGKLDR